MAQGFDVVGVAVLDPLESASPSQNPLLHHLRAWLDAGYHGIMHWMDKAPERRADPRKILPGCQSIICVGVNYWTNVDPQEQPGYGKIARYAWGKDYHRLVKKRLTNLERAIAEITPDALTRSYVDTGPIMEKVWAQRAGLGWIGKHSNLVSPTLGSWLLLGEVLTTLKLEPSEPGTDLCGTCTLCIRACPTQAIIEPYVVDATKCISYLTIEYRGELQSVAPELRKQMGNRIFGCDDCLDACPYNVHASPTKEPSFQPNPMTQAPNLLQLSRMDEDTFFQTFQGSPIRRSKHSGLQRNVKIAIENATMKSRTSRAIET